MEEIKQDEKPQEENNKEKLVELVDRLEKANKEAKEIISKQEELAAKRLLGGASELLPAPVVKEETPAEYAKRIMGMK